LKLLDFEVVEVLLPGISPALALCIPDLWAGLWLTVLHSRNVDLAIDRHVYISIAKQELV
jgi:hypothetical protein